jgi:hypothetical protein
MTFKDVNVLAEDDDDNDVLENSELQSSFRQRKKLN